MRSSPPTGRLLIIDGDALFLRTLAESVRRRLPALAVDTALSAHAAGRQFASVQYDIVLASTHLPDADASGVLTALAPHAGDASLVLMASGLQADLLIRAGLSGVHDVLFKPIEHNLLISRLQHVLEHRTRAHEVDRLRRRADQQAKRVKKVIAQARLALESYEQLLARRRDSLVEQELRGESLLAALDGASEAILLLDSRWRILALNEAARSALFPDAARDDLEGTTLWDAYPSWAESPFAQECRRAIREAVTVQFEMLVPPDGRWYTIRAVPAGHGLTVYFRDLTQGARRGDGAMTAPTAVSVNETPRSTEPEARTTAASVAPNDSPADSAISSAAIREAERTRLAQDLHHEFGPLLASFKSDLDWLENRVGPAPLPVLLKVRFMAHLVHQMIECLGHICAQAYPAILEELGLDAALQWLASTFEQRTAIRCSTILKDLEGLDAGSRALTFRSVQTLLAHVEERREASAVTMTIAREGDQVMIEVKDNGPAKSDNEVALAQCQRIAALKEQVRATGGNLSVATLPDHGTTRFVSFPVKGNRC